MSDKKTTKKKTTPKKKTTTSKTTTKSPNKDLLSTKVIPNSKDIGSSNSEDNIVNKDKRDENGRFIKGNTIGSNTRFNTGHTLSTIYRDEYADLLLEYFTDPDVVFPTLEGFAIKHNIAIRTVHTWVESPETHAQFALSHAQAMAIQRDKLLVGGLTEQYNSQIVKFIAVNCHGMKEKIEQEFKGEASINVNISFFDEV